MSSLSDLFTHQKEFEANSKLTKHPVGSFRELLSLAFPLMICALSGTLMLFIDRIVLSHYSQHAMNAAAACGVVFAIFQFGTISVAAIAEVFVGQYNGAKAYHRLAQPVWQMIWFSVMTLPFFWAVGSLGSNWLLPAEVINDGKAFFSWLMYFGPIFPLGCALASFYIGQGKVRIVTLALIVGSLVNLILDIALVFGIYRIPPLGAKGAAIATGCAQVINALILFVPFLTKYNQKHFGTLRYQFDAKIFIQCLKLGVPNACGHMVGIAAWAVVMSLLAKVGFEHITLFAICQSIWILLTFITDGSQKAVSAVCANLIGQGQVHKIDDVFRSGIHLIVCIGLCLAVPLMLCPQYFLQGFLSEHTVQGQLSTLALTSCKWIWLAFIFDSITWIVAGILTSAGDTRFIMVTNALSAWCFGVVPYYLLFRIYEQPAKMTPYLMILFAFINMLFFLYRYQGKQWQTKSILV